MGDYASRERKDQRIAERMEQEEHKFRIQIPRPPLIEPSGFLPWPKDWPTYKQECCNSACTMLVGPCNCGAWHSDGEFVLFNDGTLMRYGPTKEQ